jgi:energy-coupling factor transporter transmembrane protein EcfT
LGVSASLGAFLLVSLTHFLITKKILRGVFLGLVAAYLIGELTMNPAIKIGELQFLKPYTFIVSDENLLVAGTKVVGYAAMVFVTLMFVMTTRDSELVGALRQLRVPYLPRFFLSIFFRTLELSLLDFQTIRQAQIARGIRVKQRTIFGVLRDMAMMSVPLVATMLQRSTDIGDSLLARGFSMDHHGQEYVEPRPLSLLDGVVFAILVVLTVAVLGYSLNMFRALQALFR